MAVFLTFFIILTIIIIFLLIYMGSGNISLGGVDFIAKGKEAGLSAKEIKMFKKAADVLEMDRPLTLLGSISNIDNAILRINEILQKTEYSDIEIIDLLEDLHMYRKNIELDKLEKRGNISDSKNLSVSQQVKITVGNMEIPIIGVISEITPNYLSIDLKNETGIRPGINWNGPINIYFWRRDDAGYFFESTVIETPSSRKWNISHSTNLIRSQKREDLRVDVELNCYVYKLEDITKRNSKPMGFNGTFSQLKNLSEGGAAFLINGKIQPGIALKIEFRLEGKVVVLCGFVKDSSHNQSNNISYVRMKIIEPTFEMLSVIRPFLFIKSRELYKRKDNIDIKPVENVEEINNNDDKEDIKKPKVSEDATEEIVDVEYLSEGNGVLH